MTTLMELQEQRDTKLRDAQEITGKAVGEGRGLTQHERTQLEGLRSEATKLDGAYRAKKEDEELLTRLGQPAPDMAEAFASQAEMKAWKDCSGDIGAWFTKSAEFVEVAKQWKSIGKHRFGASAETPFSPWQVKNAILGKAPFNIGDNLGAADAYPPPLVGAPIPLRLRPITVTDLFAQGTMTQTSFTYWQQLTAAPPPGGLTNPDTGSPGFTPEGGEKPELTITGEMVQELLAKIAGHTTMSDETMEDAPAVASLIRAQLLARLDLAEENAVLNGPGGTGAITGILQRAGVISVDATADADGNNFDAIQLAMTQVAVTSFFPTDALVMNPLDYYAARIAKDGNGQYFGGGPFTGAYGVQGFSSNPGLWMTNTVVTPAIAQGTALVGNFGIGGQVYRKGGVRVETANQHGQDFIHDRVTTRAETRLLLAVYYPTAFAEITLNGDWGVVPAP